MTDVQTPPSEVQAPPWTYPVDGLPADREVVSEADEKRYSTTQFELIRRRFLRNRAALVGGGVVVAFYLGAGRELPGPATSTTGSTAPSTSAPAGLPGRRRQDLPARAGRDDDHRPETLRRTYVPDPTTKIDPVLRHRRPVQAHGLVPDRRAPVWPPEQRGLRHLSARDRSTGSRSSFRDCSWAARSR